VAWQSNGSLFGTIGEGCRAAVWDVRCPRQPAASSSCVHVQEGTCLAFDALNDNQLATGGKDAAVCVLDVRKLQRPLMRLHVHAEAEVTRVAWSPHAAGMLASAAHDGHVLLWDTRAAYDSAAAALEAPGWGGGGGAGPAAAASGAAPAAGGGGGRRKQQQPKRREPGMLAQMGLAGYSDAPKVAELLEAPPDGLLFLHAGHIGAREGGKVVVACTPLGCPGDRLYDRPKGVRACRGRALSLLLRTGHLGARQQEPWPTCCCQRRRQQRPPCTQQHLRPAQRARGRGVRVPPAGLQLQERAAAGRHHMPAPVLRAAGAVADVAWHPKRPWLLASASIDTVVGAAGQERDTPLVQVWEMQPEIVRGTRFEGL
jgi:hypothetical protein